LSTSFCLIAALIRRITARRSFSPAFIAAFMSSVSCCLRLIGVSSGISESQKREKPATLARAGFRSQPSRSVQALALGDVARGAARLALHRRGGLALALLGRLLVELALAGLGQHACLFAGALEAAQGKLERFVFADFDAGHRGISVRETAQGTWASRA